MHTLIPTKVTEEGRRIEFPMITNFLVTVILCQDVKLCLKEQFVKKCSAIKEGLLELKDTRINQAVESSILNQIPYMFQLKFTSLDSLISTLLFNICNFSL